MKISVVIPAYNEENYIGRLLKTLQNQEEKADEIIVIDNNCTDKTVVIAKRFGVKIVREKKQGMIFARNRGFNEAKYEIIARCDADTILPSNWIKKIKENFIKNKIDGLLGNVITYDFYLNSILYSKIYNWFMRMILGHHTLHGPSMAVTKTAWNRIKANICLNDQLVHEDIDLSIHINNLGGKIFYDPLFISFYSTRRIKSNPFSFIIEYPIRLIKTIKTHL